jgi:hypothetical protein
MPAAVPLEPGNELVGRVSQHRARLHVLGREWRVAPATTQVSAEDLDEIHQLMARFRARMDDGKMSAAGWALSHPLEAYGIASWIRSLGVVTIAPADDLAGQVLRQRFGGIGLLRTGRHAQAALRLPPNLDDYWRGPKRKVFRNKIYGADRCGITYRLLAPEEILGAVQTITDGRGWGRPVRSEIERLVQLPLELVLASAAFSPEGAVTSVSLAVASGDVAQIRWGLSTARGTARWAAVAALIRGAHALGHTTILVGRMVGDANEDEYFERRLGFEPSNIRLAV